jgi:predicted MFS family arabinose efflux permease
MTFWVVNTEHLPTLLLVALGASEFQIGLQGAFLPGLQVLQLPTMRLIARVKKRTILLLGQVGALLGGLPLLFLDPLIMLQGEGTVRLVVLIAFAAIAAGLNFGNTVWFPMLRNYIEPDRIGHFFSLIRSGWHVALIVYFLSAQQWLRAHPGDFAPLFIAAWWIGLLRMALIARMPERSEITEGQIRMREAVALLRDNPRLRRYLAGVTLNASIRTSTLPFVIVMMRREIGIDDGQILVTTLCLYGGALLALVPMGRLTDRIGPTPIFRMTAIGMALLLASLITVDGSSAADYAVLLCFFAGFSALNAGFGLADTRVLFELAPAEAPARTLVICNVVTNGLRALAPLATGAILEALLVSGDGLPVYHALFAFMAALQVVTIVPLRGFESAGRLRRS